MEGEHRKTVSLNFNRKIIINDLGSVSFQISCMVFISAHTRSESINRSKINQEIF